jgi:biopolymer transport protein ExbD
MSSTSKRVRGHLTPNINVTPLIDVLLVLLIIFMVISPLRPTRFKALIPQPPAQQEHVLPDPLTLVVTIDNESRLSLNQQSGMGSVDDMSALNAELSRTFQRRTEVGAYRQTYLGQAGAAEADKIEKTVFIKAPRSIPYGEVAKVVDGIKGAGANPVGLQIDDLTQ